MPLRAGIIRVDTTRLSDPEASTHLVSRIHKRNRKHARAAKMRVRVGAPDPSLTGNAGMAVVSELLDKLDVIGLLDAAIGPIKQRNRGFGAGELLAGLASAQLAGEDFLVGLDRQRADAAGQALAPVAGLASTTAAGLARRFTEEQWRAVETGVAAVNERMLALLPAERAATLTESATIDMDATDVEVYGRQKQRVAYLRGITRSIPPGYGARCSPPASPAGATNSPPPAPTTTPPSPPDTALMAAKL
jgi:hypothetical protein